MSLAEEVIEANNREEREYEIDDLGLGIAKTPDYVVARALYRNTIELEEDPYAGRLHNRKGGTELWKGNRQLKKNKKTIYELAGLERVLKDYEIDAIWESLLRNTPELDDTKIVVGGHTYWDIEKGELCHSKKRTLTI